MSHANARLTVHGRAELVRRVVDQGRPVAHVVIELNVSRATGYKWLARWQAEGFAGLHDRPSRAHRLPGKTPPALERHVLALRADRKLGPARIGPLVGLAPSTVHAVLHRHGRHRLAWLDRPTGQMVRRYERSRPGELVHVDVKKLGNIPDGGGWRIHGREQGARNRHAHQDPTRPRKVHGRPNIGYCYVHSAVDGYTRLAYSEALDDETAATALAFWARARTFFAGHGITVERVLTDNGSAYRSHAWRTEHQRLGIRHARTRVRRPQTNGKVERLNRTLLEEWAYKRLYTSETARRTALSAWLHHYNHHRPHTALGNLPPITRCTNVSGQYSSAWWTTSSRTSTASPSWSSATPTYDLVHG